MKDSTKNRIAELRENIDAVDAELLSALNRRAGLEADSLTVIVLRTPG